MSRKFDRDDGKNKKSKTLLEQLIVQYSYYLQTHPILTKSITSAITSGLGQLVSQLAAKRATGQNINYRAIAAFSGFGFLVTGPLVHYFYNYLEQFVPRGVPFSKAKKLFIDRLIFSPPFYLLFFYIVAIFEGKSNKEAIARIKANYWGALKMSLKVWPLVQFVNFTYIPVQYRVLFANLVALFWSIYLSTKTSVVSKTAE
ncbi:predicted protein [Nematostella vectensis]|uniref:Peroxisomal membrane protein 2 n=2 Tax=Nematostella vectensis TaxID=45351 RepID=A7SU19_NEMVE|nr:predicted protein [Nematostella vectensis]|eukprot:XP_001624885.1 predicted protein [Nematostella vectensis]